MSVQKLSLLIFKKKKLKYTHFVLTLIYKCQNICEELLIEFLFPPLGS